jgi:hypothetical protein
MHGENRLPEVGDPCCPAPQRHLRELPKHRSGRWIDNHVVAERVLKQLVARIVADPARHASGDHPRQANPMQRMNLVGIAPQPRAGSGEHHYRGDDETRPGEDVIERAGDIGVLEADFLRGLAERCRCCALAGLDGATRKGPLTGVTSPVHALDHEHRRVRIGVDQRDRHGCPAAVPRQADRPSLELPQVRVHERPQLVSHGTTPVLACQ